MKSTVSRKIPLVAATLLLGLALAGCTSEGGSASGASPTESPAGETSPPSPDTSEGAFRPSHVLHRGGLFVTPSGNILCLMGSDGASCSIGQHSWKLPPKPSDCDLIWDAAMRIDDQGVHLGLCEGDGPAFDTVPTLRYGRFTKAGTYVCRSSEDGIRCLDETTGHGFWLSRAHAKSF